MTDLPRFTGSLRAFAGVTEANDPYSQQRLREELQWKRKKLSKPPGLTWEEIRILVDQEKDKKKEVCHMYIRLQANFE